VILNHQQQQRQQKSFNRKYKTNKSTAVTTVITVTHTHTHTHIIIITRRTMSSSNIPKDIQDILDKSLTAGSSEAGELLGLLFLLLL
jgi:hypothetical protein